MFKVGDLVVVELTDIVRPLAKELEGRTGEVTVVNLNYPFPYTVHLDNARKHNFAADELAPLARKLEHDAVNHPSHYNAYDGIEVIQLTEQMNFNKGNAVKYVARAGLKSADTEIQDLRKAAWYIAREIERLEAAK